jgi:hypothetical protein
MEIAVDNPAVKAESELTEILDLVAQMVPNAMTLMSTFKKRDSIVIKSRGFTKIEPPMLSLENKIALGILVAGNPPLCHQNSSP